VEYYRQLQAVRETESNHKGALELQRIYVLNEYKQRHIGKLLLEKAIRIAQDEGATYLWLGVWEHNTKAIAFYLKQGFVVSGTHHFILGSDTQTDHRMLKSHAPVKPHAPNLKHISLIIFAESSKN
jgi:ribosomal protein S18 acetylase RimI-like enzyme